MNDPANAYNRLQNETSPYLLQHSTNPVDWYPWGKEAFEKAKREDKPVFLSIGYSTCHWCHVMARESFEDPEIASILNRRFVCVKVDREERPDIDSIYMTFCQAFTGSGGWPMSLFLTPDQLPFFAGTYFPKNSRWNSIGFRELLLSVARAWQGDRARLLSSAKGLTDALRTAPVQPEADRESLPDAALSAFSSSYDPTYGGFGTAPKFPAAHNLIFLMRYSEKRKNAAALGMAEHTLTQMYRGGLFDHVGFGFCRYSTDRFFLIPHFEKMLYDNALLMQAYCVAFELTQKPLYRETAEKIASYVLSEMTAPGGTFWSAQDADSEGTEGKYYLFRPEEIVQVLGETDGAAFNRRYEITDKGHFEGKSLPNLLHTDPLPTGPDPLREAVYAYRKRRFSLRTDDKSLTAWNGLMIAALCSLYRISRKRTYLDAAVTAALFIERNLYENGVLSVSWRNGRRTGSGYLDDYAAFLLAQLALYGATLDPGRLERAKTLAQQAIDAFFDSEAGGFYLYGSAHESLILRPKETYDGAMPSGNSLMAYSLVRLSLLEEDGPWADAAEKQIRFLSREAASAPMNYSMFLTALLDWLDPPESVVVSPGSDADFAELPFSARLGSVVRVLRAPTDTHPAIGGQTTFYVCRGNRCLPPAHRFPLPAEAPDASKPEKM